MSDMELENKIKLATDGLLYREKSIQEYTDEIIALVHEQLSDEMPAANIAKDKAKQIRQQIGLELLEHSIWHGYTRYVRGDKIREVCQLETQE